MSKSCRRQFVWDRNQEVGLHSPCLFMYCDRLNGANVTGGWAWRVNIMRSERGDDTRVNTRKVVVAIDSKSFRRWGTKNTPHRVSPSQEGRQNPCRERVVAHLKSSRHAIPFPPFPTMPITQS